MRILAIETSSPRGSVALVEHQRCVAALSHERENSHVEELPGLIERVLADAGWAKHSIERVAVGTGPGSFTGLRVGVALAQGISEGLEVPLVGVCSLAAMAGAVPEAVSGVRCPVLDARRGEVFFGLYSADGTELHPPSVMAAAELPTWLTAEPSIIWIGAACALMPGAGTAYPDPDSLLPHARWVGLAGASAGADQVARPIYLRPGVTTPPLFGRRLLAPELDRSNG